MEVGTFPYKWKFLCQNDIDDRAKRTRIAILDLHSGKAPTRIDLQTSDSLTRLLSDPGFNHNPVHSRIFVVEDLSRDVIEALGSQYDIDPLFFRRHILDFLWYNTRDPWTELPNLAHITQEKNYFNIRYMVPKYFQSQESVEAAVEQLGGYNVLRRLEQELSWKVRKLRNIKGSSVGVLRSKTSLWIRKNKPDESGTLAILVVDPTLPEGHPLWGGPRYLEPCPSMHAPVPSPLPSNSHFEAVIHCSLAIPASELALVPDTPHILGTPMLALVAAEWITIVTYITTTLTKIEYELENAQYRDSSTGLTGALDRLHPLRRLMPVYRNMISETMTGILNPAHPLNATIGIEVSPVTKLHGDFNSILDAMDSLQVRTQNIISLATTIISIEENQRAMQMNVNLVRVTYLAVIFVPMAFVSSFFSMTPDLKSIEQTVWIYFAVAIPLTILCVAAADPNRARSVWMTLWSWIRAR
ncbi:hypothetical protein BJ878DRAFT_264603 [Calycina marina]|uniref:Uncharacterized protein n=1 Tax=Calycina marina TaxID=1763456 RepID=A0A9P7YW84_9HELO|nr:hypothetical protein BJ878DRAFT_264603 [Calycina marina]